MEIEVPRGWNSLLPIPGNPKVSMICVAYNRPVQLPVLLNCFRAQTYQNFEIIVFHDTHNHEIEKIVFSLNDPRFVYLHTNRRYDDFGHSQREQGFQLATGDYLGTTNDDNYYVPVYFEWMLHSLVHNKADLAHCNFIHSHNKWNTFDSHPSGGRIDAGNWIGKASLLKSIPWADKGFMADGCFINTLMRSNPKTVKINSYLFIHN